MVSRTIKPIVMMAVLVASQALAQTEDPLRHAVSRLLPAGTDFEINPSPVPGIHEVVAGTQVFYLTGDGSYLLGGPLFSLAESRNLTEQRLDRARLKVLARSAVANKVSYAPADPVHRISVVTNVDCGYCRTMHSRLQEYLDLGIAMEYIMLPSGGPGSPAFNKTAGLLCAEDPSTAVTQAMISGASAQDRTDCDHYLETHIQLARDLGATTTPNLILPDGRLVRGYLPPADLLATLQPGE